MKRKEILNIVLAESEKITSKHEIDLFDVELNTKGGSTVLTVKITSDKGVNLDDCKKIHIELSDFLDELDPFEDSYFLEISSPGLDAPLKTDMALSRSIGKEVFVKTYVATKDYPKTIIGTLSSFNKESVQIQNESQEYDIERKMISTIRLHFQI